MYIHTHTYIYTYIYASSCYYYVSPLAPKKKKEKWWDSLCPRHRLVCRYEMRP